jgi:hypothetical protein
MNEFFRRKMPLLEWSAAILITLAALQLHCVFFQHAGGLWRDEVSVLNMATQPSLGQVWQALPHDHCPIVFPVLVRIWSASGLGATDAGLRCLGIGAGLLLLASFWIAGWMMGKRPPLLPLSFAALNFTILQYGDSIRAYGLGSAWIPLMMALVWRYAEVPNKRRGLLAGAVAVLSVQTLYQNAFFVLAVCIAAAVVCIRRRQPGRVPGIIGIGLAAAISLLPYVKPIHDAQTWWDVSKVGINLSIFLDHFSVATDGLEDLWFVLIPLAAVLGICAAFAAIGQNGQRDLNLFAGIALITGLAGFGLFIKLTGLPTEPWYYVPALVFAVVCCGAILPSIHQIARVGVLATAIVSALLAYPAARSALKFSFTNVDVVARHIESTAAPNDLIIVTPGYCGISFEHYYKGPTPWTTLPPLSDHSWHRYDLIKVQMQNTNAIRPVIDRITTTLQSGHRVWVVASAGWLNIPAPGETPLILPPPPLKDTGWSDLPYTYAWNTQLAGFLADHSRQFGRLKNSASSGVRMDEKLELFIADGWKDPAQPVSTLQTDKP